MCQPVRRGVVKRSCYLQRACREQQSRSHVWFAEIDYRMGQSKLYVHKNIEKCYIHWFCEDLRSRFSTLCDHIHCACCGQTYHHRAVEAVNKTLISMWDVKTYLCVDPFRNKHARNVHHLLIYVFRAPWCAVIGQDCRHLRKMREEPIFVFNVVQVLRELRCNCRASLDCSAQNRKTFLKVLWGGGDIHAGYL